MNRNSYMAALGRFGAFALVDVAVVVLSTEASTSPRASSISPMKPNLNR